MIDTKVTWPNDTRCAVLLTFDFDAETLWLGRDPSNANRPGTLSQGLYGAKVGVPSILQVLRDAGGVPATFFIPGWTVEQHAGRVEAILKDGHEVGHHSYSHRWIDPNDPAGELEEMERGLEALQRLAGIRPAGYRSPAGETSDNLLRLLVERGFQYDSSMLDAINPYFHAVNDRPNAIVELPWSWSLDDAVYALFSMKAPRPIMTNEHIFSIWRDEFDAIRAAGGLFNLVMHPQVTGRPSRLVLLRRMIEYIQQFSDVWFATCRAAAQAFAAQADTR